MLRRAVVTQARQLSTTTRAGGYKKSKRNAQIHYKCVAADHYKLVVVGGGAGGATITNKFVSKVGKGNLAIIDAAEVRRLVFLLTNSKYSLRKHYYQPGWTLVGGGMKDVSWTERNESDLLSKNATWIKEFVTEFR